MPLIQPYEESSAKKKGQAPYAIYFISKNLTPTELNYTVTEKDFLAVVYSIYKFRHYIIGYKVFCAYRSLCH